MRNRGDVLNAADFNACCLQCTDCGFTACTRSFDEYVSGTHALVNSHFSSLFSCHLCCEWCALTGAFESESTGRCPGNGVAVGVSNRYNRVVESRTNMSCTGFYMFSFFSFCFTFYRSHYIPPSTLLLGCSLLACNGLLRTLACTGIGFCSLSAYRQAFTMTSASVGTDFYQALNVEGFFSTEITFDFVVSQNVADFCNVIFCEISHTDIRIDSCFV